MVDCAEAEPIKSRNSPSKRTTRISTPTIVREVVLHLPAFLTEETIMINSKPTQLAEHSNIKPDGE
jgi:hypothetical protein